MAKKGTTKAVKRKAPSAKKPPKAAKAKAVKPAKKAVKPARPAKPTVKRKAIVKKAAARKTIMVVDDQDDVRNSVRTVLERNGYEVLVAVNGDDCVKQIKGRKVDLILLDIMMPGMPVRDVVRMVGGTKVIFLSVVRTSESERENLLKGENIVGFIQKPFDIRDLLARVRRVIG